MSMSPSQILPQAKILVIEDDPEIRELVVRLLKKEQFQVDEVDSGEQALQKLKKERYDLLVLDWMLPGLDGVELTRVLKSKDFGIETPSSGAPILMVTAKSEPEDIVKGLESGADDYITKPFDLNVFKARVRALLRRSQVLKEESSSQTQNSAVIQMGEMEIDPASHEVRCQNEVVHLTLSEFKLLLTLAVNRGRVLTRDQLIAQIQGEGVAVIDRTVDTHVFGLRKKLGASGDLIETVRGVGYRISFGEV